MTSSLAGIAFGADAYQWPPDVSLRQQVGHLEILFYRLKEAQRGTR